MTAGGRPPWISIVVPAFNSEPFLADTIRSVRAQTIEEWELIVVDDGSTDATAAVAESFAAEDTRIRVRRTTNRGVANARNSGLELIDSRSEYVILLDSDDQWETDTLAGLAGFLEANPDVGSVYGLARCTDLDGELIPGDDLAATMRERFEWNEGELQPIAADAPLTFAAIVHQNYVFTPGIHLLRRSVLEHVGEFDPAVDPADDWDFAVRVCRLGPIGTFDKVVLNWRRHEQSILHSSPRLRTSYFGARRKMMCDPANTAEQAELARVAFRSATSGGLTELMASIRAGRYREAAGAVDGRLRYLRALASDWNRRHGLQSRQSHRTL